MPSRDMVYSGCCWPNSILLYNKLCKEQEHAPKQKHSKHRSQSVCTVAITAHCHTAPRVPTPGLDVSVLLHRHMDNHCAAGDTRVVASSLGGRKISVTLQLLTSKAVTHSQ